MAGEKEINELLDRLLEGRSAEKVVGDGGLLADLTKRLMERVLEAELTDHLGYEKHTAEETMAAFEERFPMISRKWRANWANMTPFFDYPPKIRKVLYTTNVIEALNAQLRKVTKKRGAFSTPDAVRKVLCLAIMKASERWTRPVHDWPTAFNHLSLVFQGRVPV